MVLLAGGCHLALSNSHGFIHSFSNDCGMEARESNVEKAAHPPSEMPVLVGS